MLITLDPGGHVEGFGWIAETWGIDGMEVGRDEIEEAAGQFAMTVETMQGQMERDESGRLSIELPA